MTTDEILKTEFSELFVQGMRNRMLMSFFKYGPVAQGAPKANAMKNMQLRIKLYEETGNTEHLIDAGNFLMIEFMFPQHPNAHFEAKDSDDSPGIFRKDGKLIPNWNNTTGDVCHPDAVRDKLTRKFHHEGD